MHTAASGFSSDESPLVSARSYEGDAESREAGEWISMDGLHVSDRHEGGAGGPGGGGAEVALKTPRDLGTDEVQEAFNAFDTDGDGLLSPQDVQFFFEALGETLDFETSRAMVAAVDGDQDGLINFDEFLGLMSAAQMA